MIRKLAATASVGAVGAFTTGLAATGSATGRAFGASPEAIAPHISASPNQHDGFFANREPSIAVDVDRTGAVDMIRARRRGDPGSTVPVRDPEFVAPGFVDTAAALAVTWLGHATALVEIDGRRVLTDPVLSKRCSPSQSIGPARMHRAPCTASQLPDLDVVLISHDHYDHLDMATVVTIAREQPRAHFVAPIGVGAHLEYWGIASDRISEADWGQRVTHGDLTFDCVPARHFSGRGVVRNLTQWASWGVRGTQHSAFFTGDTGFTEAYRDAGGPYELTLVPIGAYDRMWPDIHVDPEEGVALHTMLAGDSLADSLMVPIHWATFNLGLHTWDDPVRRMLTAAEKASAITATPAPGTRIDVVTRTGAGIEHPDWWHGIAQN
ncbi:MBL fold metallo-hydrolase [Williamsia herbipolensis]|uniref:MBL fold metallo-hydrolase n=1 Tax=Williamsia herbipolensis TaxID=1603258 RepID=UPI0005F82E1A|nr:MBL fold metallo-hydrolase [Williamsia herbipolensis]